MRKVIKVLIIAQVLIITGCFNGTEVMNYSDVYDLFGVEFVDHFPKEVKYPYQFTVSGDVIDTHPSVWLKSKLEGSHLDSLIGYLEKESLAIYDSEDSCLLVIDGHLRSSNWLEFDKRDFRERRTPNKSNECGKELLPIPNFFTKGWEENESSPTGLKGYKFFVLEAEKGKFVSEDLNTNGAFAPEGWDNGLSKGIAINESSRAIIYWADIW